MKYDKFSRRLFLQGLSGSLLPLPALMSLLPKEVYAQTTPNPLRVYVGMAETHYDYGRHLNWFGAKACHVSHIPDGILKPSDIPHSFGYTALSKLLNNEGHLSLAMKDYLNPVLNKVTLFRGLDYAANFGHKRASGFGKVFDGDSLPTIDQVLLANNIFNPHRNGGLVLGSQMSYQLDGTPQATSPGHLNQLFDQVFLNKTVKESGAQNTPTTHPRTNILSDLLEDYKKVRNGKQIGKSDRLHLDNLFDQLSDVQRGLANITNYQSQLNCSYKSLESSAQGYYMGPDTLKVLGDILLAAFMCDRHRTALVGGFINGGFATAHAVDGVFADGLPDVPHTFHHGCSHLPFATTTVPGEGRKPNHEIMARIHEINIKNFISPLAQKMDQVIDPTNGKSLLYNSILHYTSSASLIHTSACYPSLIVGTAGGKINSGYLMDFSNKFEGTPEIAQGINGVQVNRQYQASNDPNHPDFHHHYKGISYNRFFKTILNAFDIPESEYSRFVNYGDGLSASDVPYGTFGLVGKTGNYGKNMPVDPKYANKPLPQAPKSLA